MSDLGISAARAYLQTANTMAKPDVGAPEATADKGFGDILNTAVSSVQQAGATAEGAITGAATGQADLVDVVTAVAAAEATLETVVSVRDQVIKAYQEIMRMPV